MSDLLMFLLISQGIGLFKFLIVILVIRSLKNVNLKEITGGLKNGKSE